MKLDPDIDTPPTTQAATVTFPDIKYRLSMMTEEKASPNISPVFFLLVERSPVPVRRK